MATDCLGKCFTKNQSKAKIYTNHKQKIITEISDEELFGKILKMDYPDFLQLTSHNNFAKIFSDKNLWILLLKRDYPKFINELCTHPKETYILLHNNFLNIGTIPYTELIFATCVSSIKNDNLELFQILIQTHNKELLDGFNGSISLKKYIYILGIECNAYNIVNYLLNLADYIEAFFEFLEEIPNTFFRDKNFDKYRVLYVMVLNNEIENVKRVVSYDIKKDRFDELIIMTVDYDYKDLLLILVAEITRDIVEKVIINLISSDRQNIKQYLLPILMSSDSDYKNLLINICDTKTKYIDNSVCCVSYILMTKDLDTKAINKSATCTIMNNNIALFDLLIKNTLFDPEYKNSLLLRMTTKQNLLYVLNKIITSNNINDITLNIVSYEVIYNEILDVVSCNNIYDDKSYNNDVLEAILGHNIKINSEMLQKFLLVTVNNGNNKGFYLILNQLNKISNIVLNECLQIAIKNNNMIIVNIILEYPINDFMNVFNMALDNNNILMASLFLPHGKNISDYIYDERIIAIIYGDENFVYGSDPIKFLCQIISDELVDFIFNLDIFYLEDILTNPTNWENRLSKYTKYINEDEFVSVLSKRFIK